MSVATGPGAGQILQSLQPVLKPVGEVLSDYAHVIKPLDIYDSPSPGATAAKASDGKSHASATAPATPGATAQNALGAKDAKQTTQDANPQDQSDDGGKGYLTPDVKNPKFPPPTPPSTSMYSSVADMGYNIVSGGDYAGKWTRGVSECLHGSTKKALADFTRNTYSNSSPEALAVLAAGTATGVASGLIYSTRLGVMGKARPPDEFNDIFGVVLGGAIGLVSSFGLNYRIRQNMITNEFGGDIRRRQAALIGEMKWISLGAVQSVQDHDHLPLVMLDPMDTDAVSNRVAAVYQYSQMQRNSNRIASLAAMLADKQIVRRGNDARTLYVQGANSLDRKKLDANEMDTLRFGLRVYAGPTHWGTPEAAMMIYNPELTPLRSTVPTNHTIGYSQTGAFDNVQAILNKCGVNPAIPESWHHLSRGYQVYLATHTLLWAPKSAVRWQVSVDVGHHEGQDFADIIENLKYSATSRIGLCMMDVGRPLESTVYNQLVDETKPLYDIGRNPDQWFNLNQELQNFLTIVWGFHAPRKLTARNLEAIVQRVRTIGLSTAEIDDIRFGNGWVSSESLRQKLKRYKIEVNVNPNSYQKTLSFPLLQAPRKRAVTAAASLFKELNAAVQTRSQDMQQYSEKKTVNTPDVANAMINQGVWYENRMFTLRHVDSQNAVLEPAEYYYDVVSAPDRIPGAPSVTLSFGATSVTIAAVYEAQKLDKITQSKKDLGNALVKNVNGERDIVESLLHAYMVAEPVPSTSPSEKERLPSYVARDLASAWTEIAHHFQSNPGEDTWPNKDHWVQSQTIMSHFYVTGGVVEKDTEGTKPEYKICSELNYQTDQYAKNERGVFQPDGAPESTMTVLKYCENMNKRTDVDQYIVPLDRASSQFAGQMSSTDRLKAQQMKFPRLSSDQERYFQVTDQDPDNTDAEANVIQVRLTDLQFDSDHFPVRIHWDASDRILKVAVSGDTGSDFNIVKFVNARIKQNKDTSDELNAEVQDGDGKVTSMQAQARFRGKHQRRLAFWIGETEKITEFTFPNVSPVLANYFVGPPM